MQGFFHYCRRQLPSRLDARSFCQGSTIILGMCVLLGAATAIALLITRLSPTA